MKYGKLVGLLLLVAFIAPMGSNEPAFAIDKLNVKKLFDTLERIPPAWSQKLPASYRFQLVLDDQAVLDKETGLVWERSPSAGVSNWYNAISDCYGKNVGGRRGWRLPTVEELASLIDPTQNNPALPAGHPFLNVESDVYWTATTHAVSTTNAWLVDFSDGSVDSIADKTVLTYVWCVRGGHGYDAY